MSGSTISTTVTTTVVLGSPTYPSPLSVTSTGIIDPSGYGNDGVTSATAGVLLNNDGMIEGSRGAYGGTPSAGGVGVDLSAAGTIANAGTITGGSAGYATNGQIGPTGNGVDLAIGSVLTNSGAIKGGYGSYDFDSKTGGVGGVGVSALDSTLGNTGTITGGEGGGAGDFGGVGILLQGGVLHNSGSITGGVGGYGYERTGGTGGTGIFVSQAGTIVNAAAGTITGGRGGTTHYGDAGGIGGIGVDLGAGGSFKNLGTVNGGAGTYYAGQNGSPGAGGAAVMAGEAAKVDNGGVIIGGAGGFSNPLGAGMNYQTAPGGAGVDLAGATLRNTGSITGGVGAIVDNGGYGGAGGDGVIAGAGSKVFNAATITGGAGGSTYVQYGGDGGAGVYLNGGTLTNAGTIAGGAAGIGTNTTGTVGDAVQFGTLASTLILDPGAVFVGQVAANATVNDVLLLSGQNGTLTGLGTQFTNFTTLAERPNADWTISGTATLTTGGEIIVRQNAALTLDSTLSGAATIRLDAGATLTADSGLTAPAIRFANGGNETLILNSTDPVSGTLSGFRIGDTIDLASVVNTVSTMGGTVILLDGTTAVETLTLDGNFTAAQFALTPDDHGGTDITLIASAPSPATSHASPAFASLLHDSIAPLALFAMHMHAA